MQLVQRSIINNVHNEVSFDEQKKLKRFCCRIHKNTSHITITVA
uniref:Uncharacterized protein n=1 Tax=Parascaris equorum TaxID=6256 RepID=A0A914RXX4_PAREQ